MTNRFFAGLLVVTVVSAQPSLKEAAKGKFLVGAALNEAQFTERSAVEVAIIQRHFNSITPENVMKWEVIHPEPEQYNWTPADRYVDFGTRNHMFVIGHNLVWHQQTPKWVFEGDDGQPASRQLLLERMRRHIHAVVSRYKGRIQGWDVVNEALNEDGTLRQSPWLQIVGEDYVAKAFEFAHEADSTVELYYNDYSLESGAKRRGAIELVRKLRSAGVPIAAIGTQTHIHMTNPTLEQMDQTLTELGQLGIQVMVTELDIDILPQVNHSDQVSAHLEGSTTLNPYAGGLPDDVQAALAKRYGDLFAIFAKHSRTLKRVTFWGVTDANSWLNDWPVRGRTNYPLLFDREGKPKPAFESVMQALKAPAKK